MGEQAVAEYIGTRKISAFVMDYDYNSPTAESLQQTHEPFFKTVRKAHPDIPVVFVTHPYYNEASEGDIQRKNVIKATYDNAVKAGDKNVYFVDSEDFFPLEMRDLYAVDILHPNDLGQFMMAKAIFPALYKALLNK
jgi:lysophospholipase L1-like esterase